MVTESDPTPEPTVHGLTREDLEKHKADIRKELEEGKALDRQEKEELRAELKKANDYIAQLKKNQEEADKVKETKQTMVLPPAQVTPQQAPPTPPTEPATPSTAEDQGRQRKRRLGWW